VLMHAFGQDSDFFMEFALTLAFNGFSVHAVDLEGHGYSEGNRKKGHSIERFHL